MMPTHQQYKPHGSIPGYIPGRPILTQNHKILLWSLVVVPTIMYGIVKLRHVNLKEREKLLEVEGRAMFAEKYGKGSAIDVRVDRSGGGV